MSAEQTLVHRFFETALRLPDHTALRHRRDGVWHERSWRDYAREVRRVGRALLSLGLPSGGTLSIASGNRPEWMLGALGAMCAGAAPVGIYPTLTPEHVGYILEHAECTLAIVENRAQADKLRTSGRPLPQLRWVVLLDGQPEGPTELTWDQLLARGGDSTDAELDQRWQGRAASELAVLIYTSGTTGLPKAVMLTHRNVTFSADTAIRDLGLDHHEHLLSYLPLSHIAEQLLSLHGPACGGFTVSFCPELNELGDYLRQVRPTVFFGVPRVWEKMQQKMREARRNASPLQQRIAAVARSIGLEASRARAEGRRPPLLYPLARKLIFSRVREKLGLDRAWLQASGAAAISRECLDYFASLDLPIYEVYGMSEVSGASTANVPHSVRFGTVGRPLAGTELKLADDGEILMRGPHVFAGYYKDEAATKEALSDDGWLRSGDIGELDADGFLRITDRKKDLFKTAGGKYIAPQPIEARLKAIPGVALAVVVGDARKYPAALLTLDPEAFPGRSLADAAADPAVRARLEEGVEEVNRSLASYEKLKRFGVLAAEFTIEGGELTPSLKVRRRAVASKYASDIDALYPAE